MFHNKINLIKKSKSTWQNINKSTAFLSFQNEFFSYSIINHNDKTQVHLSSQV